MSKKIYVVDNENNERFYSFVDFILKGKRLSDKFFNDLKSEFLENIKIEQAQGVDLSPYALKTDIKEVDLTGYIKGDNLAPYALKSDLNGVFDDLSLKFLSLQNELQAEISALKAKMHAYKELPASTETEIGANQRKNLQFEIPNIGDYTIMCFKQITIQGVTGGGEDWKNVVIQSFATTGGGTKCNISIYNMGASATTAKLSVVAFCKKQGIE